MADDSVAFVRSTFAAYNARDREALRARWRDDTVWAPSITGGDTVAGGEYVGHDGLDRYFDELAEVWTDFTTTIIEGETVRPGRVLIRNRITGTGRKSGIAVEMENWIAFVSDGGRIRSIRVFSTREEALESLEGG